MNGILEAMTRALVITLLLGIAAPAQETLSPRERNRRGDKMLKAGRFAEAIADFDAYIAARPEVEPYH